ncbi:hypothetical protein [Paraburkholderia caledonica]|jgi:hypothetical protein|uniref:hypothetical protein n=1 Tax=Paraburkholderia caledonica TaxID=134536 RepID=UPI0004864A79
MIPTILDGMRGGALELKHGCGIPGSQRASRLSRCACDGNANPDYGSWYFKSNLNRYWRGLTMHSTSYHCLPDDLDRALMIGRVWRPEPVGAPSVVVVRGGELFWEGLFNYFLHFIQRRRLIGAFVVPETHDKLDNKPMRDPH